jgi:hypothetical protein
MSGIADAERRIPPSPSRSPALRSGDRAKPADPGLRRAATLKLCSAFVRTRWLIGGSAGVYRN